MGDRTCLSRHGERIGETAATLLQKNGWFIYAGAEEGRRRDEIDLRVLELWPNDEGQGARRRRHERPEQCVP